MADRPTWLVQALADGKLTAAETVSILQDPQKRKFLWTLSDTELLPLLQNAGQNDPTGFHIKMQAAGKMPRAQVLSVLAGELGKPVNLGFLVNALVPSENRIGMGLTSVEAERLRSLAEQYVAALP